MMQFKLEARFTTENLPTPEQMTLLKEKVAVIIGDHFGTQDVTVWTDFADPEVVLGKE